MPAVSYAKVRVAIDAVKDAVGDENISLWTRKCIDGLEEEMGKGEEICQAEIDQLAHYAEKDLRWSQ